MTPVFIEGFEAGFLAVAGDTNIQGTTKREGDYALEVSPAGAATEAYVVQAPGADGVASASGLNLSSAYIRLYVYITTLPIATEPIANIRTTASGVMAVLRLNADGTLDFDDSGGTTLATTSALSTGTWYRVEIRVDNGTDAAWGLYLDGTEVDSGASGANFTAANVGFIQLGKHANENSSGYEIYFDDIRVDNDGYPGAGNIARLDVTGIGSDTDWDSSGGGSSVIGDVADIPFDAGDVDYAVTTTNPSEQTYTFETMAGAGAYGDPKAVRICALTRDVGGTSACGVRLRSGANVADTSTANIGGYDLQSSLTHDDEPVTGIAWTTTLVNAIEGGIISAATEQTRCAALCAQVEYEITATAIPEVPTSLAVDTSDGSSADLSWTDASLGDDNDAILFEVEVGTDDPGDPANAMPNSRVESTTDATASLTVSDLDPKSRYYVRVRAVNGFGVSAWSSAVLCETTVLSATTFTDSRSRIKVTLSKAHNWGMFRDKQMYWIEADGSDQVIVNALAAQDGDSTDATIDSFMVDIVDSSGGLDEQGLVDDGVTYDASLNEYGNLPYTFDVGGGIKKLITVRKLDTQEAGGGNSYVYSMICIAIVDSEQATTALSPEPYAGGTIIDESAIDYDAVTTRAMPAGAVEPDWGDRKMLHLPWVHCSPTAVHRFCQPTYHQLSYPSDFVHRHVLPVCAGACCSDVAERRDLVRRVVHNGRNIERALSLGSTAFALLGGFGLGSAPLRHLAGRFLGDTDFQAEHSNVTYLGQSVKAEHHREAYDLLGSDGTTRLFGGKASPLYDSPDPEDLTESNRFYSFNHDVKTSVNFETAFIGAATLTLEPHHMPQLPLADTTSGASSTATNLHLPDVDHAAISAFDSTTIYNATKDEWTTAGASNAWNNSTKILTVSSWTAPDEGDQIWVINGGGYQVLETYPLAAACIIIAMSGGATAFDNWPLFAAIDQWITRGGTLREPVDDNTGGISANVRIYGDNASGDWVKLFYDDYVSNWPEAGGAASSSRGICGALNVGI